MSVYITSEIKICTKCCKKLPATTKYFYRNRGGKFGLFSLFKECCKKYRKQRYEEKRSLELKQQNKYRQSEKGKSVRKKYCESKGGKEAKQKYRRSEKGKLACKRYQQSKNGKIQRKNYRKSKIGKEAQKRFYNKNKLSCNMSTAIYQSLKVSKAGQHWETIVPYNLKDLKLHLESLFQLGMTWDNYGKWHVDHKIPKSTFNFISFEDIKFQECWALNNLQPLWAEENIRKSNKLVW